MDALFLNNQAHEKFVQDELIRLSQRGGQAGGSVSQQNNSAFDAEYAAFKVDIARVRAEIEADKERLGL